MTSRSILIIVFLGLISLSVAKDTSYAQLNNKILNFVSQGYTIDKVLQLLKDIRLMEQQDLESSTQQWRQDEPVLSSAVASARSALTNKIDSCDAISKSIDASVAERNKYVGYIEKAQVTIQQNLQKIAEQEEHRCAANLMFIDKIRENNQAISFLQFLRGKINEPEFKEYLANHPQSLLQISEAMTDKSKGLGALTKIHMMSFAQKKSKKIHHSHKQDSYTGYTSDELAGTYNYSSRTNEEVGTGHIDNDQGALNRTGFEGENRNIDLYIRQLTAYIDELIASLEQSTKNLQDVEGEANYNLGQFKDAIELQNRVYARYIEQWSTYVSQLDVVIANNIAAHNECVAQIPTYQNTLDLATNAYRAAKDAFETRESGLISTISMLDRVIALYEAKVVNKAGSYNERVEDYVEDDTGVFDKTDYESRQTNYDIDNWNSWGGNHTISSSNSTYVYGF